MILQNTEDDIYRHKMQKRAPEYCFRVWHNEVHKYKEREEEDMCTMEAVIGVSLRKIYC